MFIVDYSRYSLFLFIILSTHCITGLTFLPPPIRPRPYREGHAHPAAYLSAGPAESLPTCGCHAVVHFPSKETRTLLPRLIAREQSAVVFTLHVPRLFNKLFRSSVRLSKKSYLGPFTLFLPPGPTFPPRLLSAHPSVPAREAALPSQNRSPYFSPRFSHPSNPPFIVSTVYPIHLPQTAPLDLRSPLPPDASWFLLAPSMQTQVHKWKYLTGQNSKQQ